MIYALVGLALLAGAGIGFGVGILFARADQSKVYDLMTSTVDKLTTSALFPGLKGVVEQKEPSEPGMFATVDEDPVHVPDYLTERGENPWDPLEKVDA